MRVRILILAVALGATATAALPASATTHRVTPQVRDGAGDWAVPSQDILDATVTSDRRHVVATIHLAKPPAQGVHTEYDVVLSVGCAPYALHYTWPGGAGASSASVNAYACPTGDQVKDAEQAEQPPTATWPATATVTATGLRIVAPAIRALRPGTRVTATVTTRLAVLVVVGGLRPDQASVGGDIANSSRSFLLGS